MLRRLRNVITFAVLVSLSAVSIGAAAIVYIYRLPDPEAADGNALFRWLVTRELRNESRQTQLKLLRRLEVELRTGVSNVDEVKENLDPAREAQLRRNLELLGSLWFRQQAATFAALPNEERNAFIDERLLQLQDLATIYQTLAGGQSGQTSAKGGDAGSLFRALALVNKWIEGAAPQEQKQMHAFIGAVQARFVSRRFGLGKSGA